MGAKTGGKSNMSTSYHVMITWLVGMRSAGTDYSVYMASLLPVKIPQCQPINITPSAINYITMGSN